MKKNIVLFIIIVLLSISTIIFLNEKNTSTTSRTYVNNYLMGGLPNEMIISDIDISKSQEANLESAQNTLDNQEFINCISKMISSGDLFSKNISEYYIFKEPIFELCYNVSSPTQNNNPKKNSPASGIRYIISDNRDFKNAEVIIYTNDDTLARKEYMLSGDILNTLISSKEENGIILIKNRVVLINKENALFEQYVSDRFFSSLSGDCFKELKKKGYVIDLSGITDNNKIMKIEI